MRGIFVCLVVCGVQQLVVLLVRREVAASQSLSATLSEEVCRHSARTHSQSVHMGAFPVRNMFRSQATATRDEGLTGDRSYARSTRPCAPF